MKSLILVLSLFATSTVFAGAEDDAKIKEVMAKLSQRDLLEQSQARDLKSFTGAKIMEKTNPDGEKRIVAIFPPPPKREREESTETEK